MKFFSKINSKKKIIATLVVFLVVFTVIFQVKAANLITSGGGSATDPSPDLSQKDLNGPEVRVVFMKNENMLNDGDKITASAVTTGFKDESKAYFTWYIKRVDGKDLDRDGDYDENDWKIEAARIIAQNGFSGQSNGNYAEDGNTDGYKAYPQWDAQSDWDGDIDEPNCYVWDYENGGVYEMKKTESVFTCPSGTSMVCASTKSLVCNLETKQACQETVSPSCEISDPDIFTSSISCASGTARCVSDYFSSSLSDSQICSEIGSDPGETCAAVSSTSPTCTFTEDPKGNICKHLFADSKENNNKTGDGSFESKEEDFWGTDRYNKSTAGNGNFDEANIVGVGINVFKWNYKTGDEVGVVVEGETVLNTSHHDGTKIITWAFSKNTCSAVSDAVDNHKRFYLQSTYGLSEGILTVDDVSLNECLEENLIDPVSGQDNGYLSVDVTHTPESPINDSFNKEEFNKGSVVSAFAEVNNSNNPDNLFYAWKVYLSSDGTSEPSLWKDITNEFSQHGYFSGIGNSNFKFKLNLSSDVFIVKGTEQYLKIEVNVSENGDNPKTGKSETIVKINQAEEEIIPVGALVDPDGLLSIGNPICAGDDYELGQPCYVFKNEIVGLKIPNDTNLENFSWKINGETLSCTEKVSRNCSSTKQTGVAFFPVIGSEGEEIEIEAIASEKGTGIVRVFNKKFQIIEPYVKIISKDDSQVWAKKIGFYKTLDGNYIPDVSDVLFQTTEEAEVALQAVLAPDGVGEFKSTWQVNGEEKAESGENEVSFKIDYSPGGVYTVDASVVYSQSTATRMALSKIWGISATESVEQTIEKSVQIEVVPNEYLSMQKEGNQKFFASLSANMPTQAMFLLRLSLAIFLIIFFTKFIFSLAPINYKNK